MGFSNASLTFAMIILSLITYSLEASVGFVAPLIPRTSPKHPLYNSNRSPKDIIQKRQRISAERELFFAQKRLGLIPNQVGPIDDELVMTYFLGTPPVEILAYPDTGSDLIWAQCQPCLKCYDQLKPIFVPYLSSSYSLLPCDSPYCNKDLGLECASKKVGCYYEITYDDNTASRGVVATDTLTLPENVYAGKFTHPNTIFGCGYYNNSNYTDYASGVVGLQNVSISLPGQIGSSSFSYCKTEKGGYIRFGSFSKLLGDKTKLFTDEFNVYQIGMLGIEVEMGTKTEKLEIDSKIFMYNKTKPNSGVLVDSGTPYGRLHPIAFSALERKIHDFMEGKESYQAEGFDLCYNSDDYSRPGTISNMPSVHFILDNNVKIEFPKDNTWTEKDIDGNICLTMFPSETDLTIIGSENLVNYNVGFDLVGNSLWLDYKQGCTL